MAVNQKPRTGPSVHGSDAAPVIYFDGISAWGINNGVIQIELVVNHLVPDVENDKVKVRMVAAAHIRCGAVTAAQLAEMLNAAVAASETKEKAST